MKKLKFLMLIWILSLSLTAWTQGECEVFEEGSISVITGECDDYSNYTPSSDNLDHDPVLTIYVNYHFILDGNGQGNFPSPANANGNVSGVDIITGQLDFINNYKLQNLRDYNLGPVPGQPTDSKIRYEIYSDPNNSFGCI